MAIIEPQGMWIGPDGSAKRVRVKGSGPLFEAFHGIGDGSYRASARDLGAAPADLARAYTNAVWAYRCVKLRADALAGVPLVLLDRSGEPIEDHPILDLLRDVNPNTMNLGDLLRATEAAYNIWGVAYWLKVSSPVGAGLRPAQNGRDGANPRRIKSLIWLNPQTITPITDSARGIIGYKQTIGSQTRTFAPQDLIVFRNFDPLDDLGGLSPLSVALNEINAELNAARFVAAFFANDARPAGLLTTDQPMLDSEVERARTWWQKLFQGAENKWKTGIVGGGLKWQTITFPPTDLALADLRAEDRRAICAAFGVPASLAGAWESATYATAREQKASFYEDTMLPQMEYIAEVLNWSLLRRHYPDLAARGARLAFDSDSITALRESATDKATRLARLFEAGIITRNEVRAGLGMPMLEDDGFVTELSRPASPPSGGSADDAGDDADSASSPPPPASPVAGASPSSNSKRGIAGERPVLAPQTLQADLDRWERFALRRLKTNRPLRAFRSTVIPNVLWWHIATELGTAKNPDDIKRIFDEAASQQFSISPIQQPAPAVAVAETLTS